LSRPERLFFRLKPGSSGLFLLERPKMAGTLLPLAKQIIPDNSFNPGVGWKIYTYEPGTLTPKATYQDAALTTPNANPVVADARGEVIMYGSGLYRVILKNAADVTIYDRDNVGTPDLSGSSGSSLVGFIQDSDDAVARTMQDKAREVFSVTDVMTAAQKTDALLPSPTLDLQAKIQAAVDDITSRGGGKLIFPAPYTYRMDSGVTGIGSDVELHIEAGAVISLANAPTSTIAFTAAGTEGTAYSLSVNATAGAFTATISAANLVSSGIASGDWVRIASDEIFDPGRTDSECGEQIRVASVNTGTGVITFYTPLADSYATADSATISKITHVRNVSLTGSGEIRGAGNNAKQCGIAVYLGYRPHVGNILFRKTDGRAIWYRDVVGGTGHFPRFADYDLVGTSGYGISVDNATQDCVFVGAVGEQVRHLFTTNNSTATKGIPRRILMANWNITNSAPATEGSAGGGDAIDTHAAAEDIHLLNGVIQGATGQGVNFECRSGSIVNVYIYDAADNGAAVHNETGRDGDYVLKNVRAYRCGGDGVKITGVKSGIERLEMDGVSGDDCDGFAISVNSLSSSIAVDYALLSNLSGARNGSASGCIYLSKINGGGLKGAYSLEPPAAGYGVRLSDSTNFSINGVGGKLSSAATGALLFIDATSSGLTTDITVDDVIGESPSAASSFGIRVSSNANNVTVGQNWHLSTFTTPISWGTGTGHKGGYLTGSATYDPASIASGSGVTTSVTVTGAAVGDKAEATFSNSLQGIVLTAYVGSANSVSVRFQNGTGGALDLASGTLKAVVTKI
jgi:hypothetical protein